MTDKTAETPLLDVACDRFAVRYDTRRCLRAFGAIIVGRRGTRAVGLIVVRFTRFRSGTSSHSNHMTMNSFAFLIVEKASLYTGEGLKIDRDITYFEVVKIGRMPAKNIIVGW